METLRRYLTLSGVTRLERLEREADRFDRRLTMLGLEIPESPRQVYNLRQYAGQDRINVWLAEQASKREAHPRLRKQLERKAHELREQFREKWAPHLL